MHCYGCLEERNNLSDVCVCVCVCVCVVQGGENLVERRWKEEGEGRREIRQDFRKKVMR